MTQILQVFYSIFSGMLTALAIPNELFLLGSPFIGIISLVPLYMAISKTNSFSKAGLLTAIQFTTTHILSSYWLGKFKGFAIFTLGASAAAYFVFGLVFGNILYASFHFTTKKNPLKQFSLYNTSFIPQRILSFAVIWTIYEWFKSTGFLAYPWGTLIMSSYKWGLISQIVSITGTWGISFLFSLFAAVIAEGLLILPHSQKFSENKFSLKMYAQVACICMILFTLSATFGAVKHFTYKTPEKTMKVSLIQNNSIPWQTSYEDMVMNSINLSNKAIADYNKTQSKPDLLVWNESTLNYQFPRALLRYETYPKNQPLIPYLRQIKIPLVSGGPVLVDNATGDLSNSAVFFDNQGEFVDSYGKIHLVPFAEVIPYSDKKFVRKLMSKIVGFSNGWTPGKYYKLFEIPVEDNQIVKFTTPICFEDAFSDLCRNLYLFGSEVFINITNDSWSETQSSEYQHFVIASFRTMELRTSMVRSCTSGYTVVIDSLGRVCADLPLFEAGYLNAEVPIYPRTMTTYALLGDWLVYLFFIIIFAYFSYLVCQDKKNSVEIRISLEKFNQPQED